MPDYLRWRGLMAIYANLHDYRFDQDVDDIRGTEVYGTGNELLGTVEDVIFDSRTGDLRYLVIDAAGWLTHKKFLVPARQMMTDVEGEAQFRVNMAKAQIENLPVYNEQDLIDEHRWNDYEQRYEAAVEAAPVLHRKDSTHLITPEPEQLPAGTGNLQVSDPRPIAMDQPRFGATSDSEDAVAERGHLGVGPRSAQRRVPGHTEPDALVTSENIRPESAWRSRTPEDRSQTRSAARFREFQERLRREREEIMRRRRDAA
jgi:sporulation protein YlmC with PRC-barrel domain